MSSKSKRFVSVFDRLGPGNDEQPGSRRFSSEKHQSSEKASRHMYPPLTSPEPVAPRERKPSEYAEKKHVHYREGGGRPHPHAPPLDHPPESDEDERFERRKMLGKHEHSHRSKVRGAKHKGSSSDSQGSESDGDSGKEGSKRRKRDSESLRRSKYRPESDGKRRHHERKDKPEHSSGTPIEVKGRPRGKDPSTPHDIGGHKRRKEDEYSDPRYAERKRKHDDELSPYEYKKARMTDTSQASPHRDIRGRGDPDPRSVAEYKRRHEASIREQTSRRYPRSDTPETTPTNKRPPPERVSPLSGKKPEKKERTSSREKKASGSVDVDEEANVPETPKALDWDYLSSYTQRQTAKLDNSKPRSALERFTPGALFARVGVSLSLAGPDYYNAISSIVSDHLQEKSEESEEVSVDPFEGAEFASVGVARIRKHKEWGNVFKIAECRRALTAADDYSMRRKLRKQNQADYLPRMASWESQHYSAGVALYQSLGKKSSGKPAHRIQESRVGELLVAR